MTFLLNLKPAFYGLGDKEYENNQELHKTLGTGLNSDFGSMQALFLVSKCV